MKLPKYLARRLSEPGLLIFEEKHGKRYFYCKNEEDFCKAAMQMLKERFELDYFYFDDDKTTAKRIVKEKDLVAAYEFMDRRSDYEYEHMKIEQLERFE